MPHHTHDMHAYLDSNVWTAYCKKCSRETEVELQQECPGQYVRKSVDNSVIENNYKPVSEK